MLHSIALENTSAKLAGRRKRGGKTSECQLRLCPLNKKTRAFRVLTLQDFAFISSVRITPLLDPKDHSLIQRSLKWVYRCPELKWELWVRKRKEYIISYVSSYLC